MTGVELVAACVLAGVLAAYLHEATHALVALAAGRQRVTIDVRALDALWDLPPQGPDWRDRLAFLAPILVGTVGGVVWVAAGNTPGLPLVIAWIVYTLNGIPGDLTVHTTA